MKACLFTMVMFLCSIYSKGGNGVNTKVAHYCHSLLDVYTMSRIAITKAQRKLRVQSDIP